MNEHKDSDFIGEFLPDICVERSESVELMSADRDAFVHMLGEFLDTPKGGRVELRRWLQFM